MILNDRKIRILEAIINDYIRTAEPIGSRTIAKKYDMGISSATIRNEMSDLEDMGLIVQPHASAGRVPSDKGYRLYVDSMMRRREMSADEALYLQQMILSHINQVDYFMQEIARYIATLTKYTTVVSEPRFVRTTVKHVQLVPLDEHNIVMILVTDGKAIKNTIIRLDNPPDYERLNAISVMLNRHLQGRVFEEIESVIADEILEKERGDSGLLVPVLSAIVDIIKAEENIQFYTSGVRNILAFPEFADLDKARAIFQALEEKEMLITLMGSGEDDSIQVVIGAENNLEQMKDCSVIRGRLGLGGQNYATVGIIGPTRMDYAQVVSVLNGIAKNIGRVLSSFTGG